MNNYITVLLTGIMLLLLSCEPAVTFNAPLPEHVRSLTNFPDRLQGNYLAADEASMLTITDKFMIRNYEFELKTHKDGLDTCYQLKGDTLVNIAANTKEKISLKGDTVIQYMTETDTLFSISPNNILKKFKGYYFLNKRIGDNAWEVKKLTLQKGTLAIGRIADEVDIQKLKEITETTADTTSTHFTLTKLQLKKFIKQDGFAEEETFIRMNKNRRSQ
jgi:hypothetical protein